MNIPLSTYRVQLNGAFGFSDLQEILPYLLKIGISHIYASPIFQAKTGSTHGYDIVDDNKISSELGGEAAFRELTQEVKTLGMSWLQDIVPNHVSYSVENKEVYGVWENGAASLNARNFDVDWRTALPRLRGKILLPILAEPYYRCLNDGQISLVYSDGFKIRYKNLELPLSKETSERLAAGGCLENVLVKLNSDHQELDELLSNQHYSLSHWRTALRHINYRRFFDIIDLIGLRQEDDETFEITHRLLFRLVKEGWFSGLRVDHIDGLYQPEAYLKKLHEKSPDTYLLVEKILTDNETLPERWPVEGTTGYDFLNYATKLFVQTATEPDIDYVYRIFTGNMQDFSGLLYEAKNNVLEASFLGDVRHLSHIFHSALLGLQCTVHYSESKIALALKELFACFPVYRTYLDEQENNSESLLLALKLASQRKPSLEEEFRAIEYLLKQSQTTPEALDALMRLQQYTGAVMAKGFEDTALYRYCRLLSLNDVGVNPAEFGISTQRFHEFNLLRQKRWPHTLNTLSTHDTKRGEDVRARLNVLSEIPLEFQLYLQTWAKNNTGKKRMITGKITPSPTEEYYLYQTMLGAFPWRSEEVPQFMERLKQHMIKATREAKVNTSWFEPNNLYEEAVTAFASEVLTDELFTAAFLPLQKKIALCGMYNSLAQTLLKITCPGVPDFYQGSELWDLNLVDPDNRRPANFQKHKRLLKEVVELQPSDCFHLLKNPGDGQVKLYLIYKALEFRRRHRELFENGEYLPLSVTGRYSENVIAYARKKGAAYAVTVVPRFVTNLLKQWLSTKGDLEGSIAPHINFEDTYLLLPDGASVSWLNVLVEDAISATNGRLPINDVLGAFPVALLWGANNA